MIQGDALIAFRSSASVSDFGRRVDLQTLLLRLTKSVVFGYRRPASKEIPWT